MEIHVAAQIEEQFQRSRTVFTLRRTQNWFDNQESERAKVTYHMNLDRMTQLNPVTGMVRPVRRVVAPFVPM